MSILQNLSGADRDRVARRFWAKVALPAQSDGCLTWTASMYKNGYGRINIGGRGERAHRVAYELLVAPIGEGLQLDHLCRNRACVNPRHLEPVTQRENILRGEAFSAVNAAKVACPYGHAYDEENTVRNPNGSRACRKCTRKTEEVGARKRTHCPAGHPYDEENTRWNGTHRVCRACHRERERNRTSRPQPQEAA